MRDSLVISGPAKGNSTAHKLACIVYLMVKYGKEYVGPGCEYSEEKYQQRILNNPKRRARLLGYELIQNYELKAVVSEKKYRKFGESK